MRTLVSILQFGGAFTAIFMAIAIFLVARKNDRADLMLAGILFLIGIVLLRTGISVSGLMAHYPHQLGVLFPLTYLIGPLLLFYARAKLKSQQFSLHHFWPHVLPMIGSYLMLIPVFLLPIDKKLAYIALTSQPRLLQRAFEEFPFSSAVNLLQLFLVWSILIGYMWVSLRASSMKPVESLKSERHLPEHWVSFLSVGLMATSFLALTSLTVILIFNVVFLSPLLMLTYLLFVVIAGYSAVQLVLRPELLHPETEKLVSGNALLNANQNRPGKKYENSGLSREDATTLSIQLKQLMGAEMLFRQHDLTLQSLAEQLNCPPKHLSQVLNENLGENFYEFINRYRVEEVKQQLADNASIKLPIIDLALNAGFNNKPAFYNAFRKNTGMTPTEYIKQKV